jgi:phytoene dehydrogenase-like protein
VSGLYLCGSGTHPGGGVMGIPGLNASKIVIADHRNAERKRWLRERLSSYSRH